MVKNPLASSGDERDMGSDSELGRSPGGAHGTPLQCSCMENPTDRVCWAASMESQRIGRDLAMK